MTIPAPSPARLRLRALAPARGRSARSYRSPYSCGFPALETDVKVIFLYADVEFERSTRGTLPRFACAPSVCACARDRKTAVPSRREGRQS